jgi:hypothetical protein
MDGAATLHRRLASYRASLGTADAGSRAGITPPVADHAERLAAALGAAVVRAAGGMVVRLDAPARLLPLDRDRLARLPGQPSAEVPLICLDTETTGLATAAGTYAFLVGLGWWHGDRFHQVQLLLPEHADEPALLDALAGLIPEDGWLVTYNGRSFDWPLLVTRFRMARRGAPRHAGHLDLLPLVRRVFRHRMADARLRTAEASLLGFRRHGDVDGWEIPGRYLDFVRGGSAEPLVDVVRHNDQDVRSLARLLVHVEQSFGDPAALAGANRGDIAGLGRAYVGERRLAEALACLEVALAAPPSPSVPETDSAARRSGSSSRPDDEPWWSPRRPPDFGGSPRAARAPAAATVAAPWTEERLLVERAHLLRRLGRVADASEAWKGLAAGSSRLAVVACVEQAKLLEHRLRDPLAALAAVERGRAICDRRRRLGRPETVLELDLGRRAHRLRRRLAAVRRSRPASPRTRERAALPPPS